MGLAKPIADYESVATWGLSLAEQWGGQPLAEDPAKLASLEAFCRFLDQDPDELLAFCFLRRRATGERFASKQRREELTRKLAEFVSLSGLRGVEARRRRNRVVSFLSHNGVLI
jgi:hypothetical protein